MFFTRLLNLDAAIFIVERNIRKRRRSCDEVNYNPLVEMHTTNCCGDRASKSAHKPAQDFSEARY